LDFFRDVMYPHALLKSILRPESRRGPHETNWSIHTQPSGEGGEKPPIDRQRLITDPHLRKEVAKTIKDPLRATPPCISSVDEEEDAFTQWRSNRPQSFRMEQRCLDGGRVQPGQAPKAGLAMAKGEPPGESSVEVLGKRARKVKGSDS